MSSGRMTQSSSITERGWFTGLLRAVIIAVSLFGGVAVAFLLVIGRIDYKFPLAAVAAVGGLVLFLRFGTWELSFLGLALAGGMLGFFALPTGTASKIPISMVVALALLSVWIVQIVTGQIRRPWLRQSSINGFVLAFVGVNIFSFVWSTLLRDPLVYVESSFIVVQAAALVVNCSLPLMVLVITNKVNGIATWKWLVWITLLIGLVGIWSEILGLPTTRMTSNGMRGLFAMWCGGFALALLLYELKLNLVLKGILVLILAGFAWRNMIQNTAWLSGWLPMVVAWAIVLWFRSKRLFALAVVVGLVVLSPYVDDIYYSVVQTNIDEGSTSRWAIWAVSLDHVRAHPLFGSGPAGYAAYYMTYHPLDARSTHNNFFDILAQTGVVGLLIFLGMLLRFAKIGLRNVAASLQEDPFTQAFAVMTLAGVGGAAAGMMLGDWVLPFTYNQTITGFDNAIFTWIFLGGIASLDWLLRNKGATNSTPSSTVISANPETSANPGTSATKVPLHHGTHHGRTG